jgi:hypothetical protein
VQARERPPYFGTIAGAWLWATSQSRYDNFDLDFTRTLSSRPPTNLEIQLLKLTSPRALPILSGESENPARAKLPSTKGGAEQTTDRRQKNRER